MSPLPRKTRCRWQTPQAPFRRQCDTLKRRIPVATRTPSGVAPGGTSTVTSPIIHTPITLFYINNPQAINANNTQGFTLDSSHILVNMSLALPRLIGFVSVRRRTSCINHSRLTPDRTVRRRQQGATMNFGKRMTREYGHDRNTSGRGRATEDARDGVRDGALLLYRYLQQQVG